jgi:hypothetical protein
VRYTLDGGGTIELDPWPLDVPTLTGGIVGYRAAGYPTVLDEVPTPFLVRPDVEGGPR